MLEKKIQKSIRNSYQNLQHQLPHFVPRRAQNYLVAEIARTLSGEYSKKERMIVAEAGTGIGKSLAYLMAVVPTAMLNNRKVVISTATVALQEQLQNKDLPLFRRISDLPFQFAIAKGRQRYCCAEKLAAASDNDVTNQLALFEQKPQHGDIEQYKHMQSQLGSGQWDGDRDSWPDGVDDRIWQNIVSDKHSCNTSFHTHRVCPFQKARDSLDKVDVIIANHSLVMADADLGGGIILPEPENTLFVFDEAHHLPHIARDHAAASASLKGSIAWLEKLNQIVSKFATLADAKRVARFSGELTDSLQQLIPSLLMISRQINPESLIDNVLRFELGELPQWLAEESTQLKRYAGKANLALAKIGDLITERVKEGELSQKLAEPALAELGFYSQRLDDLAQVWQLMAEPPREVGAPLARWIELSKDREHDYVVNVSPLEVGWKLDQQIWSRCVGAVLVSATLRALNSFSFFCRQTGISEREEDGVRFLALASPFDYENNGELLIPAMQCEPSSPDFTEHLIAAIPQYLQLGKSNLVLFSSYWQMNEVAKALLPQAKKERWLLQVQGDKSRSEILKKHKLWVTKNKTTILFGTGSFSEGLDLPGSELENVIITKIPFGVPTSPVEQAHAEYITSKGGNPFMQIAVPDASKKLIQSVGRLLRQEQDSGRVVILDRRIISKRYGKALLDSLPPFKRNIK
jgi:ATP-dependent DNA helicase DinG